MLAYLIGCAYTIREIPKENPTRRIHDQGRLGKFVKRQRGNLGAQSILFHLAFDYRLCKPNNVCIRNGYYDIFCQLKVSILCEIAGLCS